MIVADIPDLEVYNEIELLEPGYKYIVMNEEIKQYLEDTKDPNEDKCEGIIDEAFSKMKDEKGEQMNLEKLNSKFEEAEKGHMKNETEIVKAQLSISANLQPLTRDKNSIKEIEN